MKYRGESGCGKKLLQSQICCRLQNETNGLLELSAFAPAPLHAAAPHQDPILLQTELALDPNAAGQGEQVRSDHPSMAEKDISRLWDGEVRREQHPKGL